MKYLIVGLGNIGDEYVNTRHNVGFQILDAFAKASNISFQDNRLAFRAEYKIKGRTLVLIKPTTFMNLSGRAVNYWLQKEKIPEDKLLVIVDDIALPFGTLRLRPKGGDAGHNGLADINLTLGHQNYARLRFGIGDNFPKGLQVQYVLGEWTEGELASLALVLEKAADAVVGFGTIGLERAMNQYNTK
mgnify:CR=1 FL=1